MASLRVRLFGRFSARRNDQEVSGLDAGKVQELFCFLLLNRNRPHPREALAGLLWSESPSAQSRKYLRKALWQLQSALEDASSSVSRRALSVETDWIRLNTEADLWLDVAAFEKAFAGVEGVRSPELDALKIQSLQEAVQLYQGDLMEGCYLDWCLQERERLQNMYLAMLDKLMGYCEVHHDDDAGLYYGALILRHDRASERTHRRMMRLQYLSGDRTEALRQYERCATALREELGIGPSRLTRKLCEQIQLDQVEALSLFPAVASPTLDEAEAPLSDALRQLKQLVSALADIQHQAQQQIRAIELTLKRQR